MGCTTSTSTTSTTSTLFRSLSSMELPGRIPGSHLSIETNPTDPLADIPILTFQEFTQLQYFSSGCIGTVYSATHKRLGKVALKFFGYTKQFPDLLSIHHELAFLSSLRGVDGIVQLKGYIMDTEEGFIERKQHFGEFPILVMEFLEGGELPKSMQNQRNERYLSQVFRCLIIALQGIHEKRFIHRDLKLENLMLVSNTMEPKIKIIDFGSMVSLPPVPSSTSKSKRTLEPSQSPDIYRSCGIVGSPGMISPETIMNYEYTFATDIWQAGCVLYSMLSGQHAFSPNRVDKIVNAAYFPFTSPQWDLISNEAKDLISLILVKNPENRLTIPQILSHPWMVTSLQAPQRDLGDDYSTRLKSLALSRRIRDIFTKQDNLFQSRREKLESIQRVMPSMNLDEFKKEKRLSPAPQDLQQPSPLPSPPPPPLTLSLSLSMTPACGSDSLSESSPRSGISIQQTIEAKVFLLKKNIIDYLHNNVSNTKGKQLSLDGISTVIYEEEVGVSDQSSSPIKTTPTSQISPRNGSISSDTDDGSALVSSLSGLTYPSHQSINSEISGSPPTTNNFLLSTDKSKSTLLSSAASRKYPTKIRLIDYPTYHKILTESGLESYATQEIFDIFDSYHRSKIDIMDVLFTYLVMYEDLTEYYSSTSPRKPSPDGQIIESYHMENNTDLTPFDNSKLYFDMFDLNHTGVIDAKNLKVILRCLLLEEKYLSHYHSTVLHSQGVGSGPGQGQGLGQGHGQQGPISTKNSMRKKSYSHVRHRSSSSEAAGSTPVRMLSQQSYPFQQSFETIKSMRSGDYDDLFQILDEERNGFITYAQFKDFYDTLYLQLDSLPPSMF